MNDKTVLAIGAHPDDVEFGCSGTLILLKELGYRVIIVDLTKGEGAESGAEERIKEATESANILDIKRIILDLGDGKISLSEEHQNQVKQVIEEYKPDIVFAPYFVDKHNDHVNTSKLVSQFANPIYYFIHTVENENIGVDITKVHIIKQKALYAHESQIKPGDKEWLETRNVESGKRLNSKYGELFYTKNEELNLPKIFQKLK